MSHSVETAALAHEAGETYHPFPLSSAQVGMICFLITEVAFFSTLVVGYITFIGKSLTGPYPAEVFSMPLTIFSSICLLSSSATIHFATRALHQERISTFRLWLAGTIMLGGLFILGT